VIGQAAEAAVCKVVAHAGFAVSKIGNDYGEDLLVQASVNGEMDGTNLWIQVKGFCGDPNTPPHPRTCRVKRRSLARWAGMADPVIIVRWDVANDIGWWSYPPFGDGFDFTQPLDGSTSAKFEQKDEFTELAISLLAWESRTMNASRLIAQSRGYAFYFEDSDPEEAEGHDRYANDITVDLMRKLGIVMVDGDTVRLTAEFLELIIRSFDRASKPKDDEAETLDSLMRTVSLRAVLKRMASRVPGLGMEIMLAHTMTETSLALLRWSDVKEVIFGKEK
jgi:hypothetical protein